MTAKRAAPTQTKGAPPAKKPKPDCKSAAQVKKEAEAALAKKKEQEAKKKAAEAAAKRKEAAAKREAEEADAKRRAAAAKREAEIVAARPRAFEAVKLLRERAEHARVEAEKRAEHEEVLQKNADVASLAQSQADILAAEARKSAEEAAAVAKALAEKAVEAQRLADEAALAAAAAKEKTAQDEQLSQRQAAEASAAKTHAEAEAAKLVSHKQNDEKEKRRQAEEDAVSFNQLKGFCKLFDLSGTDKMPDTMAAIEKYLIAADPDKFAPVKQDDNIAQNQSIEETKAGDGDSRSQVEQSDVVPMETTVVAMQSSEPKAVQPISPVLSNLQNVAKPLNAEKFHHAPNVGASPFSARGPPLTESITTVNSSSSNVEQMNGKQDRDFQPPVDNQLNHLSQTPLNSQISSPIPTGIAPDSSTCGPVRTESTTTAIPSGSNVDQKNETQDRDRESNRQVVGDPQHASPAAFNSGSASQAPNDAAAVSSTKLTSSVTSAKPSGSNVEKITETKEKVCTPPALSNSQDANITPGDSDAANQTSATTAVHSATDGQTSATSVTTGNPSCSQQTTAASSSRPLPMVMINGQLFMPDRSILDSLRACNLYSAGSIVGETLVNEDTEDSNQQNGEEDRRARQHKLRQAILAAQEALDLKAGEVQEARAVHSAETAKINNAEEAARPETKKIEDALATAKRDEGNLTNEIAKIQEGFSHFNTVMAKTNATKVEVNLPWFQVQLKVVGVEKKVIDGLHQLIVKKRPSKQDKSTLTSIESSFSNQLRLRNVFLKKCQSEVERYGRLVMDAALAAKTRAEELSEIDKRLKEKDAEYDACETKVTVALHELTSHEQRMTQDGFMRFNSSNMQCSICFTDAGVDETVLLGCGHGSYCLECLTRYVEARLDSGSVVDIPCPNCSVSISEKDLLQVLPRQIVFRLHARRNERQKLNCGEIPRSCPTPNCTMRHTFKADESGQLSCILCGKESCWHCGAQPFHVGKTCEQHAKKRGRAKSVEDEGLLRWMEETGSKQCPTCNMVVTKENLERQSDQSSECHKMMCRNCGTKFCFKCLALLTESYTCGCTNDKHMFIDPNTGAYVKHLTRSKTKAKAKQRS